VRPNLICISTVAVLSVAFVLQDMTRHVKCLAACLLLVTFILLNNLWLLCLIVRRAVEYLA
jgi:hypothetical protein